MYSAVGTKTHIIVRYMRIEDGTMALSLSTLGHDKDKLAGAVGSIFNAMAYVVTPLFKYIPSTAFLSFFLFTHTTPIPPVSF